MDSGPTTAGSIVAKLRLDRDQWVADKAKTVADARELGSLDPTIRIKTNVAEVMAQVEALNAAAARTGGINIAGPGAAGSAGKIDAVTAAQRRLTASESASESATQRAILANMRLEAARSKRGRTDLSVANAEFAAAEATKRADAAATKAIFAEEALAAAKSKVARAALEEAAAQEVVAKSTTKANQANQTNVSRMGLIVAAVATLVPLLVPVAAFAVGAAGGLTMMGVAGVLAIVGIRKAMADGTTVGAQYSGGLQVLKGDLDKLSNTAAVGMLRYFQGAVGQINASLPMLNGQIGVFTRLLGQSGSNLLAGTLSSLRVLNPLFVTVGQYVDGLTLKFARWTENGGLRKFGSYAMSVLPTVEQFLSSLGDAVLRLIGALAPMGVVGLAVFTGLFNAITALPVDVLTNLITTVVYGTLAFKAWGFIAPMLASVAEAMGAMGVATTIATGPIGWIVAGIAALAAIVAVSVVSTKQMTAATTDYTAAVQADSGAIGENVRQQTAKTLADSGALDAAKKVGISTKLATDAIMGNAAAQKELNAKIRQVILTNDLHGTSLLHGTAKQKEQLAAVALLGGTYGNLDGKLKTSIRNYGLQQEAMGGATLSTEAQTAALEANAAAAHVSVSAYLAASSGIGNTGAALEKTTALMYLQNNAAGLLKQQMDLLNGVAISAAQAQNQFDSQLANMGAHIDKTGKAVNRATASLTNNSAAAVANQGELISATQAAQANAQAFRDNGGALDETRQKLNDMKQAIIEHAVKLGEDRAEVQAFIDKIYQIPASIPPTKIEVDTASALAKITALSASIASMAAHRTIVIDGTSSGISVPTAGKMMQGHAGGGTVRGPGTGTSDSVLRRLSNGEEVIKTASASQARPFLKAFNENPQRALAAVATSSSAGSNVIHNHLHIDGNGQNPEGLFKEFDRRQVMLRA